MDTTPGKAGAGSGAIRNVLLGLLVIAAAFFVVPPAVTCAVLLGAASVVFIVLRTPASSSSQPPPTSSKAPEADVTAPREAAAAAVPAAVPAAAAAAAAAEVPAPAAAQVPAPAAEVAPPAAAEQPQARPASVGQAAEEPKSRIPTPPSAPSTGGAAILARLRQQRASRQSGEQTAGNEPTVAVVYASQTGTAQEIARNIHAAAQEKGFKAQLASLNELTFANLTPAKAPLLILVASSTGDGDCPDNAAQVWVQIRKKHPATMLAGMQFTVLGLGDSNYTRFMYVPRIFRSRLADLGATCFYPCAEADEVDGIEDKVDAWTDALWDPLRAAAARFAEGAAKWQAALPQPAAAPADAAPPAPEVAAAAPEAPAEQQPPATPEAAAGALVDGLAPEGADLRGAPALPQPRIVIMYEADAGRSRAVLEAEAAVPSAKQLAARDPSGRYSAAAPFWAEVAGARYLTSPASDRSVLHVEISIADSGISYEPGDALGLLPSNSEAMVSALLKILKAPGAKVFSVEPMEGTEAPPGGLAPHLGWPCTLRQALTTGVDITAPPRKSLLRLLAEHCSDPAEKRTLLFLCAKAGRAAYNSEIVEKAATLVDVLSRFGSCKPPVEALLDALPPLAPRMYSLTSSQEVLPDQAQVALSVVKFDTPYGTREGVASNWLDRICQPLLTDPAGPPPAPIRVPVFLRKGGDFHPPPSPEAPLIMVGPGTGVAPFRGFLQSREQSLKTYSGTPGAAWLFFGCRREEEDFLYKEDLQGFEQRGVLTKLLVAFSRAGPEKVYVQHLMRQHGKELADLLLRQQGYMYVCGDGAKMAKDVHAMLVEVLSEHGGLGAEAAAAELQAWAKSGRYVRDIWS